MMQTRFFALLLLIFVTATLAQESPYIFDTNQVDPSFFGEGDLTPSNNQRQQLGNRANDPSSRNIEEVLVYGVAPEFNTTMGGNLTRLDYKGVGTMSYSYEPISSFGAMELSCSTGFVEPQFQGAYVGLSEQLYREAKSCGACVEISCDDKSCGQLGKKAVATVVDLCGRCFGADMNIATPMFANLTSQDPSKEITSKQIVISWRFVDCSPYINGTIKMLVKPDGNAYFQAFSFSNSRQPIVAVALLQGNGVPPVRLRKSSSNWWEYNPGQVIDPRATYGLVLLGANRQVLQVAIRGLVNQDLGVQYDLINTNSGNITTDVPPPEMTPLMHIVASTIIGEENQPAVVHVQEELPPVSSSEGITGGRKMLQNDINDRTTTSKIVNTYPELLDAVNLEDLACAFEVPVPEMYQFHYGSVNFQTFLSSDTSTRRGAKSASSNNSLITCGTCIQLTKRRDGGSSDTTTIMIVNDCQTCEDDEIAVNDFAFMELFRKRSGGRGGAEWKIVECEGPRGAGAGAGAGAGMVEGQQDGESSRRQTDLDDELFLSEIDDDVVIAAPDPKDEQEDDAGIVVAVVSQPSSIEEEQEEESSQEEEPSPSTAPQSGTAFPTMWYTSSSSQQEASFYTNMACGLSGIKPPYTTNFASINLKHIYKQGSPPPCGQCAFIQCADDENDPKCPLGKDGLAVIIAEDCGDCGPGDIRINAPSLLTTGSSVYDNDDLKVMWALAGCQSSSANEEEKEEGIYVHVAPGTGSGCYEQVTFSNSAQPIVKARFNGQELKMRGYPFRWEWYEEGDKLNGSGGRVEIELEGEDGSVVRKVVDGLESQYLGVNFSE